MKRSALVVVVMVLFVFLGVSLAQASPKKRFDPGTQTCRIFDKESTWWGNGAEIFRSNCKSCHFRGNDKGAPFLYSESKSSRAWNRVFFKKYPECAQDGSWGNLTLEDQLVLNDYLYRNANDTYDPNDADDCG